VLIRPSRQFSEGVTLIELVVTIGVLAIIVAFAVPSYQDLSQRRALQGVANGIMSAIATAKEEAIKRDAVLRVQFSDFGGGLCVGVNSDDTPCDCATAGSCPVVGYPSETRELRMVTTKTAPAFTGSGKGFSIDPKTGMLTDPVNTGEMELQTPMGHAVKIRVNAMVRARMCSSGTKPMPGVKPCA
jgi:type IV fimbrial biogenesis protein FimT